MHMDDPRREVYPGAGREAPDGPPDDFFGTLRRQPSAEFIPNLLRDPRRTFNVRLGYGAQVSLYRIQINRLVI